MEAAVGYADRFLAPDAPPPARGGEGGGGVDRPTQQRPCSGPAAPQSPHPLRDPPRAGPRTPVPRAGPPPRLEPRTGPAPPPSPPPPVLTPGGPPPSIRRHPPATPPHTTTRGREAAERGMQRRGPPKGTGAVRRTRVRPQRLSATNPPPSLLRTEGAAQGTETGTAWGTPAATERPGAPLPN